MKSINDEKTLAITFRVKPSIADGIKKYAKDNGISISKTIEDIYNRYCSNSYLDIKNIFFERCINRFDETISYKKSISFIGKIIYTSNNIFRPAAFYEKVLRQKFNIPEKLDISTWLISDSISVAQIENYNDNNSDILIQETLSLKESEELDIALYCQWIVEINNYDDIIKNTSPFINTEDIVAISSIVALFDK